MSYPWRDFRPPVLLKDDYFFGKVISASLIFLPLGRGIFETGSVPSVDGTGSFPTFLIPWVCFTSVPRPEEDMSSVPCAHRSNPDLLRWGNWRLNGLSSGSTFISPLPFHRGLWDLASVSILLIAPPLWGTQLAGLVLWAVYFEPGVSVAVLLLPFL